MARILRWLGGLLVVSCAACETLTTSCTEIGCVNGFTVALQRTAWPAGSYSVLVQLDGTTQVLCIATLPFATTSSGGTCNAQNVRLGTSGQMLPAAQQGLTDVHIDGTPKTVRIEVKRDGQVELSADLTPSYLTSTPNGPKCDPVCTQASAQLAIQ